ncbi:MAG TPA: hypothetical protein VK760_02340, partial [Candidatus Acidoferrales bacterium]|nr:hypothetical protein [Candidatus Acidoferrales bacterium]
EDVLDAVAALVDKSLLAVEDGDDERRYRLLESTREFALECLDAAGEREGASERHCTYYAELAANAHEAFWETDSDQWTAAIRRDIENYRAAINWSLNHEVEYEVAATMVADLRWFWLAAAQREGRAVVERAQVILPESASVRTRGLLALTAGTLVENATVEVEEISKAERLLAAGADEKTHAEALIALAAAVGNTGKLVESVEIAERAVAAARSGGIPRQIGSMLSSAAYRMACAGDIDRSRSLFDEAEPLVRRSGDRAALARLQVIRAELLFASGDVAQALTCVREAGIIYRERRNELWLGATLLNEAAYLIAENDLAAAWGAAREVLELAQQHEDPLTAAVAIGHLARVAAEGDQASAARLLGYVNSAYARAGSLREPTEQRGYDRALELIRAALPEDRVAALMLQGAALSPRHAAEDALAIAKP